MKLTPALLTAAMAVIVAADHGHGHNHVHKKAVASSVDDVVVVPGPTVLAYILDGKPISAAEVEEGIANGTLQLAPNGSLSQQSSAGTASLPTSSAIESTSSASTADVSSVTSSKEPSSTSSSASSTSSSASNTGSVDLPASSSSGSGSDSSFASDSTTGIDTAFPSGEIDCSNFPSDYGAVAVSWLNLGGWTGVQSPGETLSTGFADINTVVSSQCGSSGCCTEGSYCSYACPAGYQKSQWPSQQGATGQSVGGLLCNNGKLELTNPSMSSNLCMPGASEVLVLVENNLSENVAVCRTDYPGTESETVPLVAPAGGTANVTCPNSENYYNWEGSHTSAQYYVNPAGVSVEDACQWGSSDQPWGNWAPLNLGVGYSAGAAYLSIFQNAPTTSAKLAFTVTITGDNMSGTCRYSNGEYCSGSNYDDCSATTGCTVAVTSGTATFVFSN